jgi:hypothetical protein
MKCWNDIPKFFIFIFGGSLFHRRAAAQTHTQPPHKKPRYTQKRVKIKIREKEKNG